MSADTTALSKGKVLLIGSLVAAAVTAGIILPTSASSSRSASSCPVPPTPSPGTNPSLEVGDADVYVGPSASGSPGRRVEVRRGKDYAVIDANPGEVRAWAGADGAGHAHSDPDDGKACAER